MHQAICASKQETRNLSLFTVSSFAAATNRFLKTLLSPAAISYSHFSILASTTIYSSDDRTTLHLTDLPYLEPIACVDSVVCAGKKKSRNFLSLQICFTSVAQCADKLSKCMIFHAPPFLTRSCCANSFAISIMIVVSIHTFFNVQALSGRMTMTRRVFVCH